MPKNMGSHLAHHKNSINTGRPRVPEEKRTEFARLRSEELKTVPAEKKSSIWGTEDLVSTGSFIFPWQTDTGPSQLIGISTIKSKFRVRATL